MITAERLRSVLDYDRETGVFKWKQKTGKKVVVGSVAGCKSAEGYTIIRVDNYLVTAHRLAWLYVYGSMPNGSIDHVNRDRADNRIENLRLCSAAENAQNCKISKANKSGVKGVYFNKRSKKWAAQIMVQRKVIHLGLYESIEEAAAARSAADEKYHTFNSKGAA